VVLGVYLKITYYFVFVSLGCVLFFFRRVDKIEGADFGDLDLRWPASTLAFDKSYVRYLDSSTSKPKKHGICGDKVWKRVAAII
jgi:hypothetical protein